jgi:type VI secretion system secreted protein VgrG
MAIQQSRRFELKTPLGKDVLLLWRMSGTEELSQPFQWDLDLLSETGEINASDILGQKVSISVTLPAGGKRFFHGFVSEFSQGGWLQRYYRYRAVVRPWYWLLTRTADCRIYQQSTVAQIFEAVVKQYGFTDYELRLTGSYQAREYCVQYRETDCNFLSRLLEEEGIYFFFEHTETQHTLVLIDDPSKHRTFEGYETVPYYAPGGKDTLRERDHLESWTSTRAVQPGTFATTDFDFEKPRKSLAATATIAREHSQSSYEVFDYPAALSQLDPQQSQLTAKIRIQELQAPHTLASGHGNAAGLAPGWRFTLEKYPRKDQNIAYLITRALYTLSGDSFEPGQTSTTQTFQVMIDAIDARTPFRPERRTRKPVIYGAQTAMVVGMAGEEIYTDQHGRVKVQFHWDRYGKQDERSSCWVRVAHQWAGKNWGMICIPRIGQEVIVSFLEGDPDRPIITGRVYNGDSMPPYELPANATQSGIKSRSSKGGTEANFNEIRFEDRKGAEQLYVHAERNQDGVVENDETHSVGHDRSKSIVNDETTAVGHNRTETVGNNETITIGNDRMIKVACNEIASVALLRVHNVGINETINVGAAQEVNVGAAQTITVGGAQITSVGLEQMTNVGLNRSVNVAGSQSHHVTGTRGASVGKDDSLKVGTDLVIDAGQSVTIRTGSASITLKSDGTIAIKGKNITLDGSGDINVQASGNAVMKGSKVSHN